MIRDLRHARFKEQAAENRERILKAASRLMRERGISGVGVDALTEAAGMTHGSLYSQFGSKERLVEEAVAYAISAKGQEVPEVFARQRLRFRIPIGGAPRQAGKRLPLCGPVL